MWNADCQSYTLPATNLLPSKPFPSYRKERKKQEKKLILQDMSNVCVILQQTRCNTIQYNTLFILYYDMLMQICNSIKRNLFICVCIHITKRITITGKGIILHQITWHFDRSIYNNQSNCSLNSFMLLRWCVNGERVTVLNSK